MPVMVDEMNGISNMKMLFFGVVFIDQNVVVLLEWATLKKVKAAAHFAELIEVETGNCVQPCQGLHDCAGCENDMRLLDQHRNQQIGHWSRTEPDDRGARR